MSPYFLVRAAAQLYQATHLLKGKKKSQEKVLALKRAKTGNGPAKSSSINPLFAGNDPSHLT